MVVKLAPTMSRRIIAIKKLNNIMINRLQNPRTSVLPDKWLFDLSQNWETLALNFGGFSTDDIADKILQALVFHISATGYLEKGSLRFIDITDLELTAKPAVVNNLGQVVMDSGEKMVKKKNKRAAKKKERLAKFYVSVGSSLFFYHKSSLFLSPRSVPAPVPTLVPVYVPAFVPAPVAAPVATLFSHPGSPVVLSSCHVPAPATVSCCEIPAFVLPLPVLGPPLLLGPSPLRTFK